MKCLHVFFLLLPSSILGQLGLNWQNVDAAFGLLPASVHVYFSNHKVDTAPFRAYYVIADLKDKNIDFETDTTVNRRLTPARFHERNQGPLVVVNGTFFSFETNSNLNLVIKNGRPVSFNQSVIKGRGKDTLTYRHAFASAIGISKKRVPDVAWTVTDSSARHAYASQDAILPLKDSVNLHDLDYFRHAGKIASDSSMVPSFKKWKMKTAIGGGPVLVQRNQIAVTNNEEIKFAGKAVHEKHPRTAMGYTSDHKLVILAVEGRTKDAAGVSLIQLAQILKELGCVEALNLDGGGSTCLLVNGKETVKPSDATGQRPVPAVFLIKLSR